MTYRVDEIQVIVGSAVTRKGIYEMRRLNPSIDTIRQICELRMKDVDNLADALKDKGVSTLFHSEEKWMRDLWVYRNGLYNSVESSGNFAVGGMLLFADDYMLVPETLPYAVGRSKDETERHLKKKYNVPRVHFMPIIEGKDHLDLYSLLLSDIGVFVVEKGYYQGSKNKIDAFAKSENLEIKVISDPGAEIEFSEGKRRRFNTYPTNCLTLLDDSGKLLVFTSKPEGGSPLVEALSDYSAEVIQVPFTRQCMSNGSIRCITNFVGLDFQTELLK